MRKLLLLTLFPCLAWAQSFDGIKDEYCQRLEQEIVLNYPYDKTVQAVRDQFSVTSRKQREKQRECITLSQTNPQGSAGVCTEQGELAVEVINLGQTLDKMKSNTPELFQSWASVCK